MRNYELNRVGLGSFLDLIIHSLPTDVNPTEFMGIVPDNIWSSCPKKAAEEAFRSCSRLNWEAYLLSYPDVGKSGMDPILHFLEHGLLEGRVLRSWSPLHIHSKPDAPKVTVIVPNYNNAIFLGKCLDSLVSQTLTDIEIIVVDDGSSDDSLDICTSYMKLDRRVKLISLEHNQGTHIARKRGVAAASGDYLMFLDSDDFFMPYTCKEAWLSVAQGYDMAGFYTNLIALGSDAAMDATAVERYINSIRAGVYSREQIIDSAFVNKTINWNVCFRIFERSIAQRGFAELPDIRLITGEDCVEFLAMAYFARSLIQIERRLYNYVSGRGTSATDTIEKASLPASSYGEALSVCRDFCEKHHMSYVYRAIKDIRFKSEISILLRLDDYNKIKFFNKICAMFGLRYTVTSLAVQYAVKGGEHFAFTRDIGFDRPAHIKNIAFFCPSLIPSPVSRLVKALCDHLLECDFNISLIHEEWKIEDLQFDPRVHKYYLQPPNDSPAKLTRHILDLEQIVEAESLNMIIYTEILRPIQIWDYLILRMKGIPAVGLLIEDIASALFSRQSWIMPQEVATLLRNMAQCICTNRVTTLSLQAIGVDACTLSIPSDKSTQCARNSTRDGDTHTILVLTSHYRTEQTFDNCLLVLKEILKSLQNVHMLFLADTDDHEYIKQFSAKARKMGLGANVRFTGWLDNPASAFRQSSVVFAASASDEFATEIALANKYNLSVVKYAWVAYLLDANASFVIVPHNDWHAAAIALKRFLRGCRSRSTNFDVEPNTCLNKVGWDIEKIIANFGICEPFETKFPAICQEAIRRMSSIAGKNIVHAG